MLFFNKNSDAASINDIGDTLKRVVAHCGGSGLNFGAFRGDSGDVQDDAGHCAKGVAGFVSRAEHRELQEDGAQWLFAGQVLRHSRALDTGLVSELSALSLEYSWAEVAAATGGFARERRLGDGAAGTVYRGTLEEGLDAAVKVLEEPMGTGFEEEVRFLSRCRHPNVVMLLGFAQAPTNGYAALIYELLPGGDAHARLRSSSRSPYLWSERLRTLIDVARGLAHLHKHRPEIFHRDIKTANILFGADGAAKIADFGLACVSRRHGARELAVAVAAGTPGYADPHYGNTGVVTEAAEVYSFGMVILELLTGRPPAVVHSDGKTLVMLYKELRLREDRAKQRILRRLDNRAGWLLGTASGLATLVVLCVHEDSGRRPSFLEVVSMMQDMSSTASAEAAAVAAASSSASTGVVGQSYGREASPWSRDHSSRESWSREVPFATSLPTRSVSVHPRLVCQAQQPWGGAGLGPYAAQPSQQPMQLQPPVLRQPQLSNPAIHWSTAHAAWMPGHLSSMVQYR